jgi:hypothetical protein
MLDGLAVAMGLVYGENPHRLIVKFPTMILIILYVITCLSDHVSAYDASCLTQIQLPENLFESKFVIEVVSPFLNLCKGSPYDYGHPTGAFALAAAGVSWSRCSISPPLTQQLLFIG